MSAARPDLDALELDMLGALDTIREAMGPLEVDSVEENAIVAIECFCKVALDVFRKVPANRIRAVARTFELKARLEGAEILLPPPHNNAKAPP